MTIESQNVTTASPAASAYAQQLPLTFMRAGDCARIVKVRGRGDVHHHLENLGFVVGAQVRIVSEQAGNLIVEVKGAQVALDKSAAQRIVACL